MTETEAKRMVKRKHDAPGEKKSLDGWTYRAEKKASTPGGWVVERKRPEGFGWQLWRASAN